MRCRIEYDHKNIQIAFIVVNFKKMASNSQWVTVKCGAVLLEPLLA